VVIYFIYKITKKYIYYHYEKKIIGSSDKNVLLWDLR
jgi:hypothetical protein